MPLPKPVRSIDVAQAQRLARVLERAENLGRVHERLHQIPFVRRPGAGIQAELWRSGSSIEVSDSITLHGSGRRLASPVHSIAEKIDVRWKHELVKCLHESAF